MKKFSEFLIRLKPYKRKYKMFWMIFSICCMFIFQMLMYILALVVPHNESSFSYWFKGFHSIFSIFSSEPRSATGFIMAGTVLGYIPIIAIIPFLYFTFANWMIEEKLSNKFIDVPTIKYLRWARISHFGGIAILFTVIPGIMGLIGGVAPWPHTMFAIVGKAFEDDFLGRIAGISGILYYGVGMVFAIITLGWLLGLFLKWLGAKIAAFFRMVAEKYREWKEARLAAKAERKQQKLANKRNSKNDN